VPASSCRSSPHREAPRPRPAADRRDRGSRPASGSQSTRSCRPARNGEAAARRRRQRATARSPVPPRPHRRRSLRPPPSPERRHPPRSWRLAAELPRPSATGASPVRPPRPERGSPWDCELSNRRSVSSIPAAVAGPARARLSPRSGRCSGSSPWGCSSAGRAPRSHRGGQGFESPHLHHSPSRSWPLRATAASARGGAPRPRLGPRQSAPRSRHARATPPRLGPRLRATPAAMGAICVRCSLGGH
jgi:hypothetical protein